MRDLNRWHLAIALVWLAFVALGFRALNILLVHFTGKGLLP